jgi:ubiquinone/menaquinone biosynthesis C-methylase UbiE
MDLSAKMLDFGRSFDPGIEWRDGNAMALPFDATETFELGTCQQGLQFFPVKALAAREMRRVLARQAG